MDQVLDGIRVIEVGGYMAAPLVSRHLADMGADVIKVEYPLRTGDPSRRLPVRAVLAGERYDGGYNDATEMCNRNKRSIALDLHHEQGRGIVHKLVENADVFVTNFLEKSLLRLGLNYDTLVKINPKIIYALNSGWGRKGPEKDSPGFDLTAFAMSGVSAQMAWEGSPPIPLAVAGMGDQITSFILAFGIMLALFHRERTGTGQMVESSLFASWLQTSGTTFQQALYSGQDIPRRSRESISNPLWNCYRTQDDRYIQLAMIQTDPFWHDLCQALSIGEIEGDPRFSSHWQRIDNNRALISILDSAFTRRTLVEWEEHLKTYKLIWAPVYTFSDVVRNPQVWANDYAIQVNHPEYGTINTIGVLVQLSKTPGGVRTVCPRLSQHAEEILLEIGYNRDDIATMKERKVIL